MNEYLNYNLNDYNLEDILELLEIDEDSENSNLHNLINEKTTELIQKSNENNNPKLAIFFQNIKDTYGEETISNNETIEPQTKSIENPGNIVKKPTVTKLLNIDSRFRNNYLNTISTNFTINLPQKVYNATQLILSSLEMPTTFYGFADEYHNNYFWIKYKKYTGIDSTSGENLYDDYYIYLYLSDGNYNSNALFETYNEFFENNNIPIILTYDLDTSTGVAIGTGKLNFALNIDDSNSLFELNFTAPNHPTVKANTIFQPDHDTPSDYAYYNQLDNYSSTLDSKFGWKFGFRKGLYSGLNTYTAEGVVDFSGPRYLYLYLNDFNQNANLNFYTSSQTGLLSENLIARITMTGTIFSLQTGEDFSVISSPRDYFGPVNLERLEIKILDEHNRIVNLNSVDISFTLKITCLYDIPLQMAQEEEKAITSIR